MSRPSLPEFLALARRYPLVPVVKELTADTVTPTGMLLRLARAGRCPFLLESVEGGERVGRWSLAGCDPVRVVSVEEGVVRRDGQEVAGPPLAVLRRELLGEGRAPVEDLPPFAGGAVGWLGYDAVRLLERLPERLPDPLRLPQAWFGIYPAVAALDRVRQRLLLVALGEGSAGEAGYAHALARLAHLERVLAAPLDAARPAVLPSLVEAPFQGPWEVVP